MAEFAVRAESKEGIIGTLRRGFTSRGAAENYPVRLADWKRVWVERVPAPSAALTTPPPLPWEVRWHIAASTNSAFTYVHDADGNRIATLFGTVERRGHVEQMLRDAGLIKP